MSYGVESLTKFEAISLITGIDISKFSNFKTLKELVRNFSSLEVTQYQVKKFEAFLLLNKLFVEEEISNQRLNSPEKVNDYMQPILRDLAHEEFHILLLNTKNSLIKRIQIFKGTLNQCNVYPRELFREALLHSAASIVLVHNHPSGSTEPSREDILITDRLIEAGRMIGIYVADHIIIGHNYYTSLKEDELARF
jgi:DNA repair protein RadC